MRSMGLGLSRNDASEKKEKTYILCVFISDFQYSEPMCPPSSWYVNSNGKPVERNKLLLDALPKYLERKKAKRKSTNCDACFK